MPYSKTLKAMGVEENVSKSAVRVSLGVYNNKEQAIHFSKKIIEIYQRYEKFK